MAVVKATPVASFIILCLVWIPSRGLSVFISFLMVLPIIYTNVLEGIHHTDRQLLEMAEIFRGSYEFLAAEQIYENASSTDKSMMFIEGGSHNFVPQEDAEEYKGQFGDTVKNCFDFVEKWLCEDPDQLPPGFFRDETIE